MYKIILLRHGESIWNKKGLFTGWVDVGLSAAGKKEAVAAGKALQKAGLGFNYAFVSLLKRAIDTLAIVLVEMKIKNIPLKESWRLNERHYGDLQGLSKEAMIKKYGARQVFLWRRSYATRPPGGESLQDVERRVRPYWLKTIRPQIKKGKRIIIVASGNSLRALVKYLDKLSARQVADLNIPTGIPLIYELNSRFQPLKHYYLADPKIWRAALAKVAHPKAG